MEHPEEDREGYVGRGGMKLAAGFRLLGGQERAKGAVAIDVGASTGGFTQCLLESGAARVTALDVGHSQLHETLRADPRVENLERINFKTVSLQVAPGPFDFFVVDVSFVAARTMLRPLAFRLRPGAEGFILIKPQFELPEGYVWKGDVKAPGLRAWAVERVKKKGGSLGFRMLGEVDSPVVGGSGTVEILSRWVYDGPTAKLARKGDAPRPPPVVRPGFRTPPSTNRPRPAAPPARSAAPASRRADTGQRRAPRANPSPAPQAAPARPDAPPARPRWARSPDGRAQRPPPPQKAAPTAPPAPATPPPKGFGGGYADPNRTKRPRKGR